MMNKQALQKYEILLYINNWINDQSLFFDFNCPLDAVDISFKPMTYKLALPKLNKPIFYIFHECIGAKKSDQKIVYLQRRKEPTTRFEIKDRDPRQFKLLGGVKLQLKQVEKQQYKVFMRPIKYDLLQKNEIMHNSQYIQYSEPFLIIRTFTNGYPLRIGQLMKFGKMQFQLKDIYPRKENQYEEKDILDLDTLVEQSQLQRENFDLKRQCRVCMSEEQHFQQDPLISPCQCRGSTKYIHVNCLKNWIQMKMKKMKEEGNGNMYHCNQMFCEICKKDIPKVIRKNNKQFSLLSFLDDDNPFLTLQARNQFCTEQENAQNCVYITMGQENNATIGRFLDNGIILQDVTVSRKHSVIQLTEKKEFVIKDMKSKYGTLIYDPDAQISIRHNMKAFLIGTVVFAFSLKEKQEISC